jgi:endogenous inhibitor of DNA gyrase (YacG/DUF329 family)
MARCPVCSAVVELGSTPTAPFCGERCRLVDLGRWLDGSYAVTVPPSQDDDDADDEACSGVDPVDDE